MKNKKLVFIPCTKEKVWDYFPSIGPQKSKYIYIGPEFIFSMRFAKKYADRIIIFSAKHGFLDEDDYIEKTYDVTFNRKEDPTISLENLENQAQEKNLFIYDSITTYCGKLYNENIYKIFQKNPKNITIINNVD